MITATSSTAFTPARSHFLPTILPKLSEATQKVAGFVLPFFLAGCGLFFCGQGAIELYLARKRKQIESAKYLNVHGGTLVASGINSGLDALDGFKVIHLGNLLKTVQKAGSICFLLANLLALEENITTYEKLAKQHPANDQQQKNHAKQKQSAFWGILSNLGYIVATAMALFCLSTTIALVIGIISACFGGLKILYDFLLVQHGRNGQE